MKQGIAILLAAIKSSFTGLLPLVRHAPLPFMIYILVTFLEPALAELSWIGTSIVTLFLLGILAVTWHRVQLRPDPAQASFADLGVYTHYALGAVFVAMVWIIPLSVAAGMVYAALSETMLVILGASNAQIPTHHWIGAVGLILGAIGLGWVSLRLAMALPAQAVGDTDRGFDDAWRRTRAFKMPLAVLVAGTIIWGGGLTAANIAMVNFAGNDFYMLQEDTFTLDFIAGRVAAVVIDVLLMAFGFAILTEAYRRLPFRAEDAQPPQN